MAAVYEHLSVEELEDRYAACGDATASRHFQVIWLLARGHAVSQVSETAAFGERWIEQLLVRDNAEGPEAPGDLRRRNGAPAAILKPGLLDKLRPRLDEPPPDGSLWPSRKLANWMAANPALSRWHRNAAGEPGAALTNKAKRSAIADCPERRRRGRL
jgi:hypothetical protein